jgi:hypothetical protein
VETRMSEGKSGDDLYMAKMGMMAQGRGRTDVQEWIQA